MTKEQSAGLLLFRRSEGGLRYLLARPGGPYFRRTEDGIWTIPKGRIEQDEEKPAAAAREFAEETGYAIGIPERLIELGKVRQKGGKTVWAWAAEAPAEFPDEPKARSNEFELEWPPRSGKKQRFPEIERIAFWDLEAARRLLIPEQVPFLERLQSAL